MITKMARIPSFYFCLSVLFLARSSLGTFLLPDDERISTQQRTTENPQIPNHAAIDTSSVISTAQNHLNSNNAQQTTR